MKLSKETETKIMELQTMEQSLQSFAMQKQRFQISQTEVENAIEELKGLLPEKASIRKRALSRLFLL